MGVTPLPTIAQHQPVVDSGKPAIVQLERKESAASKPKSEETKTPAVTKPTEQKEQTWQDNPQNCNQDTQYISKDKPFDCIDKPVATASKAAPVRASGTTSGNCRQWLIDAGVNDLANAVELQSRENGSCNPQLYNQGGSDACGVAQELPCGKSGCGMPPNADGACQIRWMNSYVLSRYGSWANAVAWHNAHNWY